MRGPRPAGRRTLAIAVGLAALVAVLGGCSGSGTGTGTGPSVADQGYVSGDGTVRTVSAGERDAPVSFRGPTLDGGSFSVREHRGSVVVVNVWGSWCPPCIAEAPGLQRAWERLQDRDVEFVGINVNDNTAAALAHEERFGVTYPSIADESGRLLLSLRGTLPPQAVPSTLVLDRQGRVAARVLGQVEESTLRALVTDTLASGR